MLTAASWRLSLFFAAASWRHLLYMKRHVMYAWRLASSNNRGVARPAGASATAIRGNGGTMMLWRLWRSADSLLNRLKVSWLSWQPEARLSFGRTLMLRGVFSSCSAMPATKIEIWRHRRKPTIMCGREGQTSGAPRRRVVVVLNRTADPAAKTSAVAKRRQEKRRAEKEIKWRYCMAAVSEVRERVKPPA